MQTAGDRSILTYKTAKVLAIVGLMLAASAAVSLVYSAIPMEGPKSVTITPNQSGVLAFTWSIVTDGAIRGAFHVEDGSQVVIVVLNQPQYAVFHFDAVPSQNVYSMTASASNLTAALPGRATYYVVFLHSNGPVAASSPQVIDVNLTFSGIESYPFAAGLLLLLLGGPALYIGVRRIQEPKPGPPPTWKK